MLQDHATEESELDLLLIRIRDLDSTNQKDAALDLLFDKVDDLLLAEKPWLVDYIIEQFYPEDYSTDIIFGLATITFAADNILYKRKAFMDKVASILEARGETHEPECNDVWRVLLEI
jgi:hypothetical protein